MNNIKALFFATLRDYVGVRSIDMQIPPQTDVAGLKALLKEQFPALKGLMSHMLISVNHTYAFNETIIPDNAEVAIFPPVSGG